MKAFIYFTTFLFSIGLANAQLKTENIAIFKNGTAFIQKSGTVKTENSSFLWKEDLPQAINGTFWFASKGGVIKEISSYTKKVEEEKEWTSFFELIKANTGKNATLTFADGKTQSGQLYNVKGSTNNGTVVLKTGTSFLLLKDSEIKGVKIEEVPLTMVKTEVEKPVIQVEFITTSATQNLQTMYLSGGFNWTPMYRLVLKNETEGELFMRASLVNDGEDIAGANVKLVVGSPNMFTTTTLSDLLQFGQGTISPRFDRSFSNQASGSFYEQSEMDRKSIVAAVNQTATGMEDLYLFELKNITLKKNSRAFYPLFDTKVKVEHKYVCTLEDNNSVNNNYYQSYKTEQIGAQAYHQLKMWNNSKNPFSSGTILVNKMNGGLEEALATAKLDYTAIENCAYITLSNAPDIEIKQEEIEIERTGNTKHWNNNKYVAVKVQATITVKSYKGKTAHMELKKLIYGELEKTDLSWERFNVINQYYINQGNNVTWSFDLEAGKEKKIVYTYTVYIRG